MREDDLISVVLPIYKVEKFLDECINSVVNQTYTNLEIILVDDGSPDNCPAICDEWAEKDKRIRVIHKKNGGLSSARNAAIDIAKGKYITFIDSDDYVTEVFVEQLYTIIKESGAGTACCRYTDKKEVLNHSLIPGYAVYTPLEAITEAVEHRKVVRSAHSKLYRTDIFTEGEGIRYPEGIICEDIAIMPAVFTESGSVAQSESFLYYYRQQEESIMHTHFHTKYRDYYTAFSAAEEYTKQHYPQEWPELSKHFRNDCIQQTMKIIRDVCISDNKKDIPYEDILRELIGKFTKREAVHFFLTSPSGMPKRIMALMTAFMPKLAIKIIERSHSYKPVIRG